MEKAWSLLELSVKIKNSAFAGSSIELTEANSLSSSLHIILLSARSYTWQLQVTIEALPLNSIRTTANQFLFLTVIRNSSQDNHNCQPLFSPQWLITHVGSGSISEILIAQLSKAHKFFLALLGEKSLVHSNNPK
jgi:hypothetical protein